MFTYRKYLTILSLFLTACSVSKEKVSIIHEPSEKEVISQSQIESSENGINNFIDGMMFMEQGEYARAIIEFQEAIDKGSNSSELFYYLSDGYWMIQKYEKSISFSKKAIANSPNALDYRVSLGKKLIALNELDEALEVFLEASELESTGEILFIIGDIKLEIGDIDGALIYYRQAYKKDKNLTLALEVAAKLALEKNHREKFEIAKELFITNVASPEYLRILIESIQGNDNNGYLLSLINDFPAVETNPLINNLYNQIGFQFLREGKLDQAEKYFLKSININSNDRFPLYYLAVTYQEQGKFNESIELSRKYIQSFPNDRDGYINKIISYLSLQNYEEALNELNIVKEIFQSDFEINYLLGLVYYNLKQFIDSELYYSKALEIDNKSIPAMHGLAMVLDQNKKWVESDKIYESLLKINPNDAQALNNYAYSLVERNEQLSIALEMSIKSNVIEKDNPSYLDTLGWIYFKTGELKLAEEYIAQSLLFDENSAVVLEHYADVLVNLNEIERAIIFYKKSLLIEENESIKEKIENLE